jgi:hypothetical protein
VADGCSPRAFGPSRYRYLRLGPLSLIFMSAHQLGPRARWRWRSFHRPGSTVSRCSAVFRSSGTSSATSACSATGREQVEARRSPGIASLSDASIGEYDFFIAHAGGDSALAEHLFDLLNDPARVFLDSRCMKHGDPWDLVLPEAQRRSRVTVVIVSPRTESAFYQREEIAAAIDLARRARHRVVPVFVGGPPSEDSAVPYGLRRLHYAVVDPSDPLTVKPLARQLLGLIGEGAEIVPELVTLNERFADAEKRGDRVFFAVMLADDLKLRRADGTLLGKDEYLDRLGLTQYDRLEAENVDVMTSGNNLALVSLRLRAEGELNAKRWALDLRSMRLFMKRNERWQCVIWLNTPEPPGMRWGLPDLQTEPGADAPDG